MLLALASNTIILNYIVKSTYREILPFYYYILIDALEIYIFLYYKINIILAIIISKYIKELLVLLETNIESEMFLVYLEETLLITI